MARKKKPFEFPLITCSSVENTIRIICSSCKNHEAFWTLTSPTNSYTFCGTCNDILLSLAENLVNQHEHDNKIKE